MIKFILYVNFDSFSKILNYLLDLFYFYIFILMCFIYCIIKFIEY